jgi:hypothetical protein
MQVWRRALLLVALTFLAGAPLSARAYVTLDWEVSNITCGLTDVPLGTTIYGDCDTLSFSVSALPNQRGFLTATIAYHYTDDGLPLNYPAAFQTDAFGTYTIAAYESAGLLALGSGCSRPFCDNPDISGVGYQMEIISLNDQPDDLTGSVTFATFFEPSGPLLYPRSADLFIDVQPVIYAAVPEPSTLAIMLPAVLGLTICMRRRRHDTVAGQQKAGT